MIVRERVMELLDYDPETGVFKWRTRSAHRIHVGDVAGCPNSDGYRQIRLDGRSYKMSRLAFLIVHGRWPQPQIDHINGVRDDDRIVNLREVDSRGNNQNRTSHRNGKLCGAALLQRSYHLSKPWKAQIKIDGKERYLGYFGTEREAYGAYVRALEERE